MNNLLLTQLSQLLDIMVLVLKPAIAVYLAVYLLTLAPQEKHISRNAAKGAMLFVLQSISIVLLSYGAIPPLVATLSAQQISGEWYITYLFTFASGGILFLWIDNLIRELPLDVKGMVQDLITNVVKLIGTTAVAFTLISVALAVNNNQTTKAGWWAIPVVLFAYGFLLHWLVDNKPILQKKVAATTTVTTLKPTRSRKTTTAKPKRTKKTVVTKKTTTLKTRRSKKK